MFRQSVGPRSYRTLKNFGFYSRCNGRPWMGWEGRGLSTEVTWSDLYFSKITLATPLEKIIKMMRFEDKTNHEFLRTRQQKLLDTCFYYCLCLRPTEWYAWCFRVIIPLGRVYMNYSDTSPFNELPVFRGDYTWLPPLLDRTHFQSTAHISHLDCAWLLPSPSVHSVTGG